MTEQFNPRSEKYEYITIGHIGDELLKHVVFNVYSERVIRVEGTSENGHKVTRGYL